MYIYSSVNNLCSTSTYRKVSLKPTVPLLFFLNYDKIKAYILNPTVLWFWYISHATIFFGKVKMLQPVTSHATGLVNRLLRGKGWGEGNSWDHDPLINFPLGCP